MTLHKISEEVFVMDTPIVRIGDNDLAFLKRQASMNSRKRARICAHPHDGDALHEMVIAMSAASYIHPHKHIAKTESFHIIEGQVDVVMFADDGAVVDVIELGEKGSQRKFYYRLNDSMFHTLLIRTDFLIVHEVTNGPFDPENTILASFAPLENETKAVKRYIDRLSDAVSRHLGH